MATNGVHPEASESPKNIWFITGTTSGFGRRLVTSALRRGDRVIATGRSTEKLNEIVKECDSNLRENLITMELDVTEEEAAIKAKVEKAAATWGGIDVLVNNAGFGISSLVEEGGVEMLRSQAEVNVFGVIKVTVATLPFLRASRGATLVIVGSRSAWRPEIPGLGHYSASKAATHSLAETWSVELAPFNIRVLLVAPGSFRTEGIYSYPPSTIGHIPPYDEIRNRSTKGLAVAQAAARGDPAKAMEILVDVVRGEGVAKGRKWPMYLILGDDAERDVRAKCTRILNVLDEWSDVARSANID